ncbi:hypothetical protein C8Q79DRAFT_979163 [Trametes meyenii]|nr:hypothetical protein C8Q79DRAFT_979163 [Trametes meyenii]
MPPKRARNDVDVAHTMTSKAPTRGRKRFNYDLQNAIQSAEQGVEAQGLRLTTVSLGSEDGSFDCVISQVDGELEAALTVLVSDASEYPSDHTFFCSPKGDVPEEVSSVIDTVYEDGALTIQDLVLRLLERISKRLAVLRRRSAHSADSDSDSNDDSADDMDEEEEIYGMDDYDMDDHELFDGQPTGLALDQSVLQREFNEIVAHGYQPGFVRFGVDDFALSTSLPVKSLADLIPPRALIAWDKRLLSGPHHFTLLISGLRGVYPVMRPDGYLTPTASARAVIPQFRVGLYSAYKPTKEDAAELLRRFGLTENYDAGSAEGKEDGQFEDFPEDEIEDCSSMDLEAELNDDEEVVEEVAPQGFRPFSLSSSLESLLNGHFLQILQLRIQYGLGWAGAEVLRAEIETTQRSADDLLSKKKDEILLADEDELDLADTYHLPIDCLLERNPQDAVNLPLVAFSYLMRRLALCPRYCLVCHQQLKDDLEALKPYVCSSSLCTYQYYNLNRGPSLEYDICANTAVVDLLVSLTYIAAAEGSLDEPLPIGMGLRVEIKGLTSESPDGLHEFDQLEVSNMRIAIRALIDKLPAIVELKRHLEQPRKPGRARLRLQDIDPKIPDAAWLVLRWIVASCTAHLEELQSDDEKVKNMDPAWRQFRFSVGAPDAEARFRKAVQIAKQENPRAREFPSLYGFHGSPAKNWHSIIRHGLWYKAVANGRAYGDGVYFAKDGQVSTYTYAQSAAFFWRNSSAKPSACVALAEIVNLPNKFKSTSPHLVVPQTEWIVCRYLMVRGPLQQGSRPAPAAAPLAGLPMQLAGRVAVQAAVVQDVVDVVEEEIPYVPLDPQHPLTLHQALIRIPEPSYALEKLLKVLRDECVPADYDEVDMQVFSGTVPDSAGSSVTRDGEIVDRGDVEDDWKHDRAWVDQCTEHLMPPPAESSPMASTALQKELRAMLREQNSTKSLRELGWYVPEDVMGDNLYQWIVELHSFESTLPVAKDLANKGVNSLVFEIRFPPTFPHSPPFFRILKPRFLPFIHGGGGHVTGGGSMCMDLLTADGWLPSYSISAVLLQIKLAISNLEPRPARLAQNWDAPYGMYEALEGYKRAATTHGWKVPEGLDKLAR